MRDAIVVDSSALIALIEGEDGSRRIRKSLLEARRRHIGAFSVLECSIVAISRRGLPGSAFLDQLTQTLKLETVPLSQEQVYLARSAWNRYGKGRHPASLNIGDCCTYAVARGLNLPLLCKGDDFPRTDLNLVEY